MADPSPPGHPPDLDGAACRDAVARALAEDRATSDITTALLSDAAARHQEARFLAEARLVVAGLPVVAEVFRQLPSAGRVGCEVSEGTWVEPGATVATVAGPAVALLAGERVALNFLQRLSGIATLTRRMVEAVAGTGARVTHTRKTTPGFRDLERYAVQVGGGVPHRASLADAVLFKDNHWALLGATDLTLDRVLARAPAGVPVIVEVETEQQLDAALAAGVTRILADNQPPERIAAWVRRAGPSAAVEASGGITLETIRAYAEAGAAFVSVGALTHSAPAAAIRFEIWAR